MSLQIQVFSNCDDAFIVWRSNALIPDCIGFELRRIQDGQTTVVNNRVNFTSGQPDLQHPTSSALSPLRRYTWTDHGNKVGDKVAYQVVPVAAAGNAAGTPREDLKSPVSDTVTITGELMRGSSAISTAESFFRNSWPSFWGATRARRRWRNSRTR